MSHVENSRLVEFSIGADESLIELRYARRDHWHISMLSFSHEAQVQGTIIAIKRKKEHPHVM